MARSVELTPGLVGLHAQLRAQGVSIPKACKEAGHSVSVYYRWKAEAEAGKNGLFSRFREEVLKTPLWTPDQDWRRIDYFQSWVAGEVGAEKPLILDSGEVWEPEQWQLDPIEDLLSDLYQAIWLVVPEGNGKTTMSAAAIIYLLEHQLTPEIPIGSATTTQAETLFRQIEGFIVRSERLDDFKLAPGVRRIDCRKTAGHTRVYPHNERSGDGVIPSASVLDEGHLHPDLRLYRTWKGKYRKRRGPVIGISTAGDPSSQFEELRGKVLKEGEITRDEGEYKRAVYKGTVFHDWAVRDRNQVEDMEAVARANPLEMITAVDLAEKFDEPEMTPEHWLRRTCNIAAREEGQAIQQEDWDALAEEDPKPDRKAWACAWLDLAWKIDTTAIGILVWESHERRVITDVKVFEAPVDEADVIEGMCDLQRKFSPVTWVFDPSAGAEQMAQMLEKGEHPRQGDVQFEFTNHSQDPAPMALAASRFAEAIRAGWLVHDGDETLRKHVLNAVKNPVGSSGDKWRFDRPPSAKGERRAKFPIDALIGVAMGHSVAVEEHDKPDAVPLVAAI